MSALNLRLPDSIPRHIREIAGEDGVSINTFITSAVAEKIRHHNGGLHFHQVEEGAQRRIQEGVGSCARAGAPAR